MFVYQQNFQKCIKEKALQKIWEKWQMGYYSTSWFLNYSIYKTRVACIIHVSHTPKKLNLNKIISLCVMQDLLVIVLFCISSVLISGGESFFLHSFILPIANSLWH